MSHLIFEHLGKTNSGITDIWVVRSVGNNAKLGEIRWFSSWRRYTFQPENSTIYDVTCLNEVSEFIAKQMELRR